jgi:hypothetical protein
MYTEKNFKTKKQLKEAVAAYNLAVEAKKVQDELSPLCPLCPAQSFTLDLPLQSRPVRYFQPGPFGGNEPQNGTFCCEGPHYPAPHTWYATCTAKDGVIVKVK